MWWWLACAAPSVEPAAAPVELAADQGPPAPVWPNEGSPLSLLEVAFPEDWEPPKILVDPGHGAPGNFGTRSSTCEDEAVFAARAADAVLADLSATGAFALKSGRPEGALVPYDDRIAAARSWAADLGIGLHSDAREGTSYAETPAGCPVILGASGFGVLWSDEGDPDQADRRHALATAISVRMIEAGFPPFEGGYGDLYDRDPAQAGVWVDRHLDRYRIKMLRRMPMPYVIVETHEAADPAEAARWRDPWTLTAFSRALEQAIVDVR